VLAPSEPVAVIKEEVPREKLQTADHPISDNVNLQEKC
jgi:hypothetical protein